MPRARAGRAAPSGGQRQGDGRGLESNRPGLLPASPPGHTRCEDGVAGRTDHAMDILAARVLRLFPESRSSLARPIKSDHILNFLPEILEKKVVVFFKSLSYSSLRIPL